MARGAVRTSTPSEVAPTASAVGKKLYAGSSSHTSRTSRNRVARSTLDAGDHEDRAERAADGRSRGHEDRDARRDQPERRDLCRDPARIVADERDADGFARRRAERGEARRRRRGRDDRREPEPPPRILAVRSVARRHVKDPARDERPTALDRELAHRELAGGHDVGGKRYAEQSDRGIAELP